MNEALVTPAIVQEITERLEQTGMSDKTLDDLREQFPEQRITHCFEDDIVIGKPVSQSEQFEVYLFGGDEHCLSLTNDYEIARGLVIAEVIEE